MTGISFIIIAGIVLNFVAIKMTKKITRIEIYTSILFVLVVGMATDVILDLHYNLYGHFGPGPDLLGSLTIFGVYPAINIILLNYFPWDKHLWHKGIYVAIWTCVWLAFEWLSVHFGAFYHVTWKYWHSVIVYPLLILIIIGNLLTIQKWTKHKG